MDSAMHHLKVAILSDVSVGYGTSQVLRMAESFSNVFGADVYVFEPDQSERPPINLSEHVASADIHVERLYSSAHPYSFQGRAEYCARALVRLRSLEPHILLFSTMYGIQVLDGLDTLKTLKIFYCLEDIDTYYDYLFPLVRQCDIRIYPEENRRRLYSERLGLVGDGRSDLIIYNSNNWKYWTPPKDRKHRIFYGGSFDRDKNFASYFLANDIRQLPIDIFGMIRGFENDLEVAHGLNGINRSTNYMGYREANASFFKLLSSYLFTIVIWNPEREDHFYACPNKFFDSVACGVPPICAPHPQCIEIIKKWNCGILLDDWSFESLRDTLVRALSTAGSEYYFELSSNCREAMQRELSWDMQFDGLVPFVKSHIEQLGFVE
ncbi:MAG: glycosyltransferase [Alphaproteobacteria bacterium]|nr:glycosyltransferase [Alphaproteobacteria bacterium]